MSNRKRSTWAKNKSASPAPANPGYAEYWGDNPHPAAKQDPGKDDYLIGKGDPSTFGEDVHPGPYANGAHPATPEGDLQHPASKRAAQMERWAEAKATKCLSIAEGLLGKTASRKSIKKQAFALMNLPDTEIDATMERMGGGFLADQNDPWSNLAAEEEGDLYGCGEDMGMDDEFMGMDEDMDEDMVGMDDEFMGMDDMDEDMMGMDEDMGLMGGRWASMQRQVKALQREVRGLRASQGKMSSNDMLREMLAAKKSEEDDEEDDAEKKLAFMIAAAKKSEEDDKEEDDEEDDAEKKLAFMIAAAKKSEEDDKEDDDEEDDDKEEDDKEESGKEASLTPAAQAVRAYQEQQHQASVPGNLDVSFGHPGVDEMSGELSFNDEAPSPHLASGDFDPGMYAQTSDPMGLGGVAAPDAQDAVLAEVFGNGGIQANKQARLKAARLAGASDASNLRPSSMSGRSGNHASEGHGAPAGVPRQRPQPRKKNAGVRALNNTNAGSAASSASRLGGIWDSAPDVSDHFS